MAGEQITEDSATDRREHLHRFMVMHQFTAHRSELIAEGFSSSQVKNWVRSGRLITLFRSVFTYGRDVETREWLWRAAVLAAGPGSALVGRSACEALGIARPRGDIPRVVDVGSPTGQARRFKGLTPALRGTEIRVVRREFEPGDIMTVDGVRTVKAAFALIGFAGEASERELYFAFLEASRLLMIGPEDAGLLLARMFHRQGARKLRPLLTLWDRKQ